MSENIEYKPDIDSSYRSVAHPFLSKEQLEGKADEDAKEAEAEARAQIAANKEEAEREKAIAAKALEKSTAKK